MSASINDLATQATNGSRPSPTTLTATHTIGGTTLTCGALTGWPTATAVHFITYTTDTSGNKVAGTQVDWKGIVSGSTITNCVVKAGSDQNYSIGAIVEAGPTAAYANDVEAAITQDHDTQGRHTQLTDVNSKKVLGITSAGSSAVNDVVVGNATTGNGPTFTAEGTDTDINLKLAGKGAGRVYLDGAPLQPIMANSNFDYVESGCVWTADAVASTRNGSMTAGVVWLGGHRLTVALVTAHSFTASKDTYIDLKDNGDATATIQYTEVTNNAASPAFSNSFNFRLAVITTGAGSIAATTNINQGQTSATTPVVSSQTLNYGLDSLGNSIYCMEASRKMIRFIPDGGTNLTTTSATYADFTNGYSFVYKTGTTGERLYLWFGFLGALNTGSANAVATLSINGTVITPGGYVSTTTNQRYTLPYIVDVPASTSVTIKPQGKTDANTLLINAGGVDVGFKSQIFGWAAKKV